jgi:hypothetical protein
MVDKIHQNGDISLIQIRLWRITDERNLFV